MEGNRIQFVYKVQNKGRTTLRSVYVYENLTGLEVNCTFYQNGQDLFSIGMKCKYLKLVVMRERKNICRIITA